MPDASTIIVKGLVLMLVIDIFVVPDLFVLVYIILYRSTMRYNVSDSISVHFYIYIYASLLLFFCCCCVYNYLFSSC